MLESVELRFWVGSGKRFDPYEGWYDCTVQTLQYRKATESGWRFWQDVPTTTEKDDGKID